MKYSKSTNFILPTKCPLLLLFQVLKEITPQLYKYNDEITDVIIGEGVEIVGKEAFYECSQLTNLNLSSSLKEIGDNAFRCCFILGELRLPSSLVKIGNYAFEGCSALHVIIIPDTVNEIGCCKHSKDVTGLED